MVAVPTEEEITKTLFGMPKSKAPGPDGFSVEFYWEALSVVGPQTIAAVKEFFVSSRLQHSVNATAISLVPKIPGADRLTLFRPIALCTTVYKVISRLLKKKLQVVVADAVQTNQVGFVKGRLLCENVLLASELVSDFHLPGHTTRGCLKVDLTKAYDNLDWRFLLNVLEAIDLPPIVIDWIKECVTTPSYNLVINGELHGYFEGKKGLRQGDPISSLLFVLAMDVLSKKLDKGVMDGVFGLHPSCEAPLITHLSFADDILIFFDGTEDSLRGILSILEEFRSASGLSISLAKSELMIDGGCPHRCQNIASDVGIKQGALPVRYLVVPLSSKKMNKSDYQPLLDKIMARFNSWSARHLSFAGRLKLIQSVIYSSIAF